QTSIGFGLTVPKNGSAAKEHAGRVREMFGRIARRYDLLNHLLSGNVDKRWRRIVATRVREKLREELSASTEARVLDVACGTGDLSLSLFEITGAGVVGTDFCRPMLAIAAGKTNGRIRFIEGDALDLPFRDGTFDVATIAFGLRNLSHVESGLAELSRVLKPGGCTGVFKTRECDSSSDVQSVLQKATADDGRANQRFAKRLYLSAGIGTEVSGSVSTLAPDGAGGFRS